jgi:phosphopantetheinyl transferase
MSAAPAPAPAPALPGLARDVLLPLTLRRADGAATRSIHAALCLAAGGSVQLRERRHEFLHGGELQRLDAMISARRADDFLVSRYACKRAALHLRPQEDAHALHIVPGVFNQPVLESTRYLGLQVSLSHGSGIGAGLATPETHPMAVDIEHYVEDALDAIVGQLTPAELALLPRTGLARLPGLTVLWAMKEALSKVLRCGLMVPFTLLELERFERDGVHITGWFRHFSQYRAVAVDLGGFTCALALPRESHGLVLDPLVEAFSNLSRQSDAKSPLAP